MKTSAADTQEVSENTLQHIIIITRAPGATKLQLHLCWNNISSESMFAQRSYSILGRAAESALRRPNHSIHFWSQQTAAIQAVADPYRFVHGVIIMTAHSRVFFFCAKSFELTGKCDLWCEMILNLFLVLLRLCACLGNTGRQRYAHSSHPVFTRFVPDR